MSIKQPNGVQLSGGSQWGSNVQVSSGVSNLNTDKAQENPATEKDKRSPYNLVQQDRGGRYEENEFSEDRRQMEAGRLRLARAGRWVALSPGARPPDLPGCYAIVGNGRAYYVGQSKSIRMRFREHGIKVTGAGVHTKSWGYISGATVKTKVSRRAAEHLRTEGRLIDRLQPMFNKRFYGREGRRGFVEVVAPSPGINHQRQPREPLISIEDLANELGVSVRDIRSAFAAVLVESVPQFAVAAVLDSLETKAEF